MCSERIAALGGVVANLVKQSVSAATMGQYKRAWNRFVDFAVSIDQQFLPASSQTVALFVAHLVTPPNNSLSSSIASSLSAISFVHKILFHDDPCPHFVIRKMLKGLSRQKSSKDSRLPVTPAILHSLVSLCAVVAVSEYEAHMLKAMFGLMFHAFLRIGEVTPSPHCLQFEQLQVSGQVLSLTFNTFKHSPGYPITLQLSKSDNVLCPFKLVSPYLSFRGSRPGLLFVYPSGKAMSANHF